jgi:hypothetical protein
MRHLRLRPDATVPELVSRTLMEMFKIKEAP